MPGPGSHLLYTFGTGLGLHHVSHGHFSVRHCFIYAVNALVGPDVGSVFEWATHNFAPEFGANFMSAIHHPVGYILILGGPLSALHWWFAKSILPKIGKSPDLVSTTSCGPCIQFLYF